ncbi:hypothetical protein KP806_15795 [Paenibacillus sp. N4]|uniref:hypothetical protein n=1 Tax=Paenibacillus vietnamensis TaxID=2590547 RepID=UPI001CD1576D|nr:hypothetical protein [Paenibacillus vietnamensis]MCA0756518.1 hypothetical protein [Paenibacillus vietnamensis]
MIYRKNITIMLLTVMAFVLLALGAITIFRGGAKFLGPFQSFSVKIINQSKHDIVSIETGIIESASAAGIVEGDSKDRSSKTVKSGEEVRIKPKLSLSGEGAVYLKFSNSGGEEYIKTVCSYTESLSGFSEVTVRDDGITVEEDCR